jgi:hypothetical protein
VAKGKKFTGKNRGKKSGETVIFKSGLCYQENLINGGLVSNTNFKVP